MIKKWIPLLASFALIVIGAAIYGILMALGQFIVNVTGDPSGGAWVGIVGAMLNIPILTMSMPWPFVLPFDFYYSIIIGLIFNGFIASLVWQAYLLLKAVNKSKQQGPSGGTR